MATLHADLIRQHEMETGFGGRVTKMVRTYLIADMDTSEPDEALYRLRNVSGLPAQGDPIPGQTLAVGSCTVTRIWFGDSDGKNATVHVYYDSSVANLDGNLEGYFYIQRSARMVNKLVTRLPDGTPIKIDDFEIESPIPGDDEEGTITRTIKGEVTAVAVRVPVAMLEIVGTGLATLPYTVWGAMGTVNVDPYEGLPPGYWQCAVVQERLGSRAGERGFYIALESQVHKPWIEDIFLVDKASGKTLADGDDLSNVYQYGIQQSPTGGAATVGYYPQSNFSGIFGVFNYLP
jgi:hypothetical protein